MTVSMVMLLDTWVNVWVHAWVNAWVHWWVQQSWVTWSSLHGSNNSNILYRWVGTIIVVVLLVVVRLVMKVRVVKLRLLLEVLVLLLVHVVVVHKLRLVTNSNCSGSGSCSSSIAVQWLLHQSSSVLSSLLLTTNHGEVWLRRMVVSWVDHSQDPHLRILLVILVVRAVEFIWLFLHLLGLILLWRVQVGNQSVSTLGSLGVSNSLSLGSILDGGSERTRSLTLEVDGLWLGGVDDNLTLLLLVEHSLDILDQLLLAGESLDDVTLAVSRHEVTTILVVNSSSRKTQRVLVLRHLLLVQLLVLQLLVQVVLLQWVLLQVLMLQVLVLHVQLLLLHLLLLHLSSGGAHVNATVILTLVVMVSHHGSRVLELMVGQCNGSSGSVVHLLMVKVLLLKVLVLGSKALTSGSLVGGRGTGHGCCCCCCCCWLENSKHVYVLVGGWTPGGKVGIQRTGNEWPKRDEPRTEEANEVVGVLTKHWVWI